MRDASQTKPAMRAAAAAYIGLALVHVLAGLFPDPRTWGMHQLAFVPRLEFALLVAVLAGAVVPRAARVAGRIVWRFDEILFRRPAALLVAGGMATAVFYALRLRVQFSGDGPVWQYKLLQHVPLTHFDPLSSAVTQWVATRANPGAPQLASGLPSIGAGALYVGLTWWICRTLWDRPGSRALAWLLLLLNPLLLLFFGYTESYPLVIVMQAAFIAALTGAARGRWPGWVPAGVAGIAIAVHLQTLAWLPALPALACLQARAHHAPLTSATWRRGAWRAVAWPAGALALAAVVLLMLGSSPVRLLRDLAGPTAFGGAPPGWFWSWHHLLDIVNECVLLLGPALVLGASTLHSRAAWRAWNEDRTWGALVWMIPGTVLAQLLVCPQLGGARDWDLFAMLGMPLVLLAVEAWSRADRAAPCAAAALQPAPARLAVAGWAVVLSLAATLPWLAVNLDATRAARRLEVLQEPAGTFSPQARGQANELLGLFYRGRDPQNALQAWQRASEAVPTNLRYARGLGSTAQQLGHTAQARAAWQRVLELDAGNAEARQALRALDAGASGR